MRLSLQDVRRSIFELRPAPVEINGLADSLEREVNRLRAEGLAGNAKLKLEVKGQPRRLSSLVEDEVFRIAQEGLSNALRHAHASTIAVTLSFMDHRIRLVIKDDGVGFQLGDAIRSAKANGKFGLTGINERTRRLGANLEIVSGPGNGTKVVVDVPLASD